MDDRLSEREMRQVAQGAGMGEKAVIRLLGSQRIPIEPPGTEGEDEEEDESNVKVVDIGLRLNNPEVLIRLLNAMSRDDLLDQLKECFKSYAQSCPLITAWVGRGDFNPRKLPPRVSKVHLQHATATAARVRAQLLRKGRDPIYH